MKRFAVMVAMLTVLGAATASHAAAQVIVAAPGAEVSGQFDGADVAVKAAPFTFLNLDAVSTKHNVVSDAVGPDSAPWCAPGHFAKGFCPLIWSPIVGAGATSTIDLRNAVPGTVYTYRCQIHANMKGTLLVVA